VNYFKILIKKILRSKGFLLVKITNNSTNESEYNLKSISNSQLDLINKFSLELNSVLHIGAHYGEEAQQYWDAGIRKVTFIEADPETFKICERNISKFPNFMAICALLTNSINQTHRFYISSNDGMSSSVLKPGRHLLEHPDITFDSSKYIAGQTLDSLKLHNHDLVVIDVQGAEDLVILGGMQTIDQAKYLFIEVNSGELYINDASITKLINLLDENFVLINLEMNNHYYGDAFFINKQYLTN
jgi:FkbM family methyltransferase